MADQYKTPHLLPHPDETREINALKPQEMSEARSKSPADIYFLPEISSPSLDSEAGIAFTREDSDSHADSNDSYYSSDDFESEDEYEDEEFYNSSDTSMSPTTTFPIFNLAPSRTQTFTTAISGVIREYFTRRAPPNSEQDFQNAIDAFRDILLSDLRTPSDTSHSLPTEAKICSYILREGYRYPELTKFALRHLTINASNALVLSHGSTEARFVVIPSSSNIPRWDIYAPHSTFLALNDALERGIPSLGNCVLPPFPEQRHGESILGLMRRKEAFLKEVLELPIDVLLGVRNLGEFLCPIETEDETG
ncbi:hypothetical protein G7Y89_g15478 [Cudoniella acicularis]|uniref:Uncharacterized protein n=1 Tax=Cudoniella acicularis TaxID=354080 RepID=A0A8H4VML9_9HELO|nr:hypothetical protein G7Y89_g15478 [Cudoniella acicularis]